jgi:mannose-6-phosphate isomerase-like protein (cupin superfamily)
MPVVQQADVKTISGANFTAVHTGPFSSLDSYKLDVPALNRTVQGKLFLKEFLGATGMQISMNKLPAGATVPFYHQHKDNEEVYIIVGGCGQMQIDEQVFDVEEGSVIRISTQGSRCIRNNSNEELHYICIQAKENSLVQETFEDGVRSDKRVSWPQ